MKTEKEIEQQLIKELVDLKYTYREDIRDNESLSQNFRQKFQGLNRVNLSDSEFSRLMEEVITDDVYTSSKILRAMNSFERDDGTPLNYTLVNIKDWCKNTFEVINQLRINTDNSHHRYDVILLINGIPVVQIELKTLEISPRRAIQQIVDYKSDVGNGYTKTLLSFMQIFIVSNEANTYYFANNNKRHFSFDADERFLPVYRFADQENTKITNLYKFAESFLSKCTLGQMISRYMVLVAVEQKLLMMRPYQIYAVKAIVDSIHNQKGNGYIWHTTGSGKTLTSFKASTLLKDNPNIEKCLFVVDRKDLDRQTREEFNKFQEGCVEENTNTDALVKKLISTDYADKVIVTTIQKLGLALSFDENKYNTNETKETKKEQNKQSRLKKYMELLKPLQDKRLVFIFDECHRSQFGDNHDAIRDFFPNAQLFGFTGTPIFEENAVYKKIDGTEKTLVRTSDVFENELHTYTITHAIDDKNVLQFHIDYYEEEPNTKVQVDSTAFRRAVIKDILKKHNIATSTRKFNAILATSSIDNAIEYHQLFGQLQQQEAEQNPEFRPLNIACVFSPPVQILDKSNKNTKDVEQLQEDLPQEKYDNQEHPNEKKKALDEIIETYNKQYGTNHNLANFDIYYQDVQKRIKDHQYPDKDYPHHNKIDITIVVDMLLTGFDSKYLNTLYVDKNLKYHGLIQAFSRTNRILNDTKPYGNIIDYRNQRDAVEDAVRTFSGKKDTDAKEIWIVDNAAIVIDNFNHAVKALDKFMHEQGLECTPDEVANIKGNAARATFINLFKDIQRYRTQLEQYTDLTAEDQQQIEEIIPNNTLRSFKGMYLETAREMRAEYAKNNLDNEDLQAINELDFEFVLFASDIIDYDYIMRLIAQYTKTSKKQTMTKEQIISIIDSDSKFINERDDIIDYINTLKTTEQGLSEEQIKSGYEEFKDNRAANALGEIIQKYRLNHDEVQKFVNNVLLRKIFDGELLSELFTAFGLGWKARAQKEMDFMQDLIPWLKKQVGDTKISGLSAYEQE